MRSIEDIQGNAVSVFQGLDTDQITREGLNPDTYAWYWQPVQYYGDTLWSNKHTAKEGAVEDAKRYYNSR